MDNSFLKKIVFITCAILYCYVIWSYVSKVALESLGIVSQNPIVSYCILALFIITCFFSLFCLHGKNTKLVTCFLLVYLNVIILTLIHSIFSPLDSRILLFQIALPVFLFFYTYRYFLSTDIGSIHVFVYIIIFIILSISILRNIQTIALLSLSNEFVTSSAYTLLFFLPPVLCINNKYIRYTFVGIVAVALFLSNKRLGVVSFSLSLIVYLLTMIKQSAMSKRIVLISTICLFAAVLGPLIYSTIQDSYIFERMSALGEDGGSGRSDVYKQALIAIRESSFDEIILGHGWNTMIKDIGLSAHNDFLELTYDFGILVTLFYLYFIFQLLNFTYRLYKENNKFAAPMIVSIIIFIIHSSFSHIFLYPENMMSFVIFWGVVIGNKCRINNKYISFTQR